MRMNLIGTFLLGLVIVSCGSKVQKNEKLYTIITTRVDSTHAIEFRDHTGAFAKELLYVDSQRSSILNDSTREERVISYRIEQNRKILVVDERQQIAWYDMQSKSRRKSGETLKGVVRVISSKGDIVWEKAYRKPDVCYTDAGRQYPWDLTFKLAKEVGEVLITHGSGIPDQENFAYVIDWKGAELFDLQEGMTENVGILQSAISYHAEFIGFLLNQSGGDDLERVNYFYHIPSDMEYYDLSGKRIGSIRDNGVVEYRDPEFNPVKSSIDLKNYIPL